MSGASRSGYVYLLSNPSMPGLVKIGRTSRDPVTRARELTSASGVPTPFKIEGFVRSQDAVGTEAAIHRIAGSSRVNSRREFFRMDPVEAVSIARRVATEQGLRFSKPCRGHSSPLHLLSPVACYNAALASLGFDHSIVWLAVVVNAVPMVAVPSRVWNALMRSFGKRPMMTHAAFVLASAAVAVFAGDLGVGNINSVSARFGL